MVSALFMAFPDMEILPAAAACALGNEMREADLSCEAFHSSGHKTHYFILNVYLCNIQVHFCSLQPNKNNLV